MSKVAVLIILLCLAVLFIGIVNQKVSYSLFRP